MVIGSETAIPEILHEKLELYSCKVELIKQDQIKKKAFGLFWDFTGAQVYESKENKGEYLKLSPDIPSDGHPRYIWLKDISPEDLSRWKNTGVYLMQDTEIPRVAAIKKYGIFDIETLRSARLMAQFNHKNIQQIYDLAITNNQENTLYLVGEYLEGETLEDWYKIPHSLSEIADIINQISSGVAYIHRKRIIHGDLKPIQIIFDQHGIPKIIDFDSCFSCVVDENGKGSGICGGTPNYGAPEQRQGVYSIPN